MNRNTSAQYDFDKEIFTDQDVVLLCYALPNIIYFIAMLFGCIMPIGVTIGLAVSISVWVTLVELSKSAYILQTSGWRSVAAMLRYYPTRRSTIRFSRYFIIFKGMLLELILTAIPMILFFYFFDILKFLAAIITVAVTMSVVSIIGIELSLAAGQS